MTVEISKLRTIADESTRPLERELARDRRNLAGGFGEDLQLRYTLCGIATAALQQYLLRRHAIPTDRLIATPPKAPREVNSRRMSHVILRHEGYIIDPTYSQFLTYVGVDAPEVLGNEELRKYFPTAKIAVMEAENSESFTDALAEHAYKIIPDVKLLTADRRSSVAPYNALVSATLPQIKIVFADIWNIDNYSAYPVDDQDGMLEAATRIADKMLS